VRQLIISLIFILLFSIFPELGISQSSEEVGKLVQKCRIAQIQTNTLSAYHLKENLHSANIYEGMAFIALFAYKRIISNELDSECTFYPSCSAFSVGIIREKGIILGLLLTADRLTRCHQGASGEYADYLLDRNNDVVRDDPTTY